MFSCDLTRLLQRIRSGIPCLIDDPSARHIRYQIGLQGVVQIRRELLTGTDLFSQLRSQLGEERLLAFHAAGIGPISDRHPAADKGLCLISMQRQGRALGHCRVYGGEIILQCHSDTACQIVQLRDAIHVHGHVKINGFSQQKTFHCLTGILAAFLLAIAEAMRKADLHFFGADGAAKVAQHGAFCHGIPVDLQLTDDLTFRIDDDQPLEISLATLVSALALHSTVMVYAHHEDGGQPLPALVCDAVVLLRFHRFRLGQIPACFFNAPGLQPASPCIQDHTQQKDACRNDQDQPLCFSCLVISFQKVFPLLRVQ